MAIKLLLVAGSGQYKPNNSEGILKKHFGMVSVLLFVVFIVLVSVGVRALPLAGARLLGQGRSVVEELHDAAGFAQLALPRVAVYLADAFLVLLGVLVLLFINMLVMVPIQLYRLQRQVKNLEDQVSRQRREMFTEISGFMAEVGQESPPKRALEESGIISRSPRATA